MPATTDRSCEEVLNVHLARLLRESLGLNTVAEKLRDGTWPDVIEDMPLLSAEAGDTLTHPRALLAKDPSIHSNKRPEPST